MQTANTTANVTFNTHKAVKALKNTGFDEEQAEAVVEVIDKAVNETVATKADLEVMAAKMAAKMATRDDLKGLATKDELKALKQTVEGIQENIKENMATKADLAVLTKTVEGIQENIKENMATKTDIKDMATNMAKLETRMMRMMYFQAMLLVGMFVTVVVRLL